MNSTTTCSAGWTGKNPFLSWTIWFLCGRCLREVIRIRRLEEALTEDALARADRVPWLDRVKRLISELSFPVSIYAPAMETVRGLEPEPQESRYTPGTDLEISAEAPADGYVTVFHGCEETGKVELVFPRYSDDDPWVLAGQEMPPISGQVEGPPGKHWFKVFWTLERLFDPEGLDLANQMDSDRAAQTFVEALAELREEDWRVVSVTYTVMAE